MKKSKKKDQAFLFEQIEKAGDVDFDYANLKTRINILQYEKSIPKTTYTPRLPKVLVAVCSLLFVTIAIGFGGWMMSRRGSAPEPGTSPYEETIPSPESQSSQKLPALYPDDVLLWQGDVYIRTDLTVKEDAVGDRLGQVTSDCDPGNPHIGRDDPQFAIAEHLKDGTPFHQVTDEENYIAIYSEEGYVIYQRQHTPDTTTP
ncbi:MAG: hypothetical protein E7645_04180 [Ruminococcaceae bacterium]|nr:hypothetical protein [Oscillospiraceae bacterium]